MTGHLPLLVVALPLAAAAIVPVLGVRSRRSATLVALAALAAAHLAAVGAAVIAIGGATLRYEVGGWAPPWGIELVVDPLSGAMAVLVSFMALLAAVWSSAESAGEPDATAGFPAALHLLLTAGLLGIVVTGDVFNLYVFLEVSALAAYALLAGGGPGAPLAVFRYVLVGTVAGLLYLLGVGFLYAMTGTLNMADLARRLPETDAPAALAAAVALVVVGLAIKAAVLPLHGWLPDVYAEGPPGVVAFVASVMGKVALYVMLRLLLFVFPDGDVVSGTRGALVPVAAVAMLAGSAMAVAQQDARRMFAWSSVGQTGYVVLGLGLGGASGLAGALLHVGAHALAKGCLFFAVGNLLVRSGTSRLAAWTGAARRQPWTVGAVAVAGLSIVGLPPFAGFFSKWYLLTAVVEGRAWPYAAVIVASSLLSATYVVRLLERAWADAPPAAGAGAGGPGGGEAPALMVLPVVVLAAALVGLGLLNQAVVAALVPAAAVPRP